MNGKISASDLMNIGWASIGQFWFLYALFFSQSIVFILRKHENILIALTTLMFLFHSNIHGIAGGVAYGMPYLVSGYMIAKYGGGVGAFRLPPRHPAWVAVLVVAFSGAATLNWQWTKSYYAWTALPSTIIGVVLAIYLARILAGFAQKFFSSLGEASMTIYVLHVITGSGMRVLLIKCGVTSLCTHLLVGTMAGVALPYLIHHLLHLFGLLPWLGLAARRGTRNVVSLEKA